MKHIEIYVDNWNKMQAETKSLYKICSTIEEKLTQVSIFKLEGIEEFFEAKIGESECNITYLL
jgi:hypothetical protein